MIKITIENRDIEIIIKLHTTYSRFQCPVTEMCELIVAGIGSNVLNEVVVPTVSWQKCKDIYPTVIVPTMMCAGWAEGKRDTCQGDSGGPLVKPSSGKWFLYGITSVGSSCAEPNKPGIYTNVVLLRSWIRSFTNGII